MANRNNLIGIGAMCVAMLGFVSNDTLVKLSSEALPLGEVIFIRGAIATILVAALIVAFGQRPRARDVRNPAILWRTVGDVGATVVYLTALTQLPLANATIVLQTVPLMVAAASALFFRERVGWRRWTAITAGLVGVVIVIRPGLTGFNIYALMALAAVLMITLRDISTSRIPSAIPTYTVLAVAVVATLLAGAAMGLNEVWIWPDGPALFEAVGAGLCLVVAYSFLIIALRSGELSLTAPFRYTVVLWAILLGFAIWGDRPDALTIVGATLIVGGGIFTIYREQRIGKLSRRDTMVDGTQP